MATFKICGIRDIWITGVKKITHLGNFDLEDGDRSDGTIFEAVKKAGLNFDHSLINLMQFEIGDSGGVVCLIEREKCFKDADWIYIFPYRSGFLMSDGGQTIDRI